MGMHFSKLVLSRPNMYSICHAVIVNKDSTNWMILTIEWCTICEGKTRLSTVNYCWKVFNRGKVTIGFVNMLFFFLFVFFPLRTYSKCMLMTYYVSNIKVKSHAYLLHTIKAAKNPLHSIQMSILHIRFTGTVTINWFRWINHVTIKLNLCLFL